MAPRSDLEDHASAKVVKCLAPHLSGMLQPNDWDNFSLGFSLQPLLPAAAQLEQVTSFVWDPQSLSLLGQFHVLNVLHVNVLHPVQLTAPLPQLHTLTLRFDYTKFREVHLQCLFCLVPVLRQLVLDCWVATGLDRWDLEALVSLPCQQLNLLTLQTHNIDEDTVKMLARIQCPLELRINILQWRCLGAAPLLTLLARLPNLVALRLAASWTPWDAYALWDQCRACLPHVQKLEIEDLPLPLYDSHLFLQGLLSMCPTVKHLCLSGWDTSLP